MGKAALLMVIASTIIMVGVTRTRVTVEYELVETQANYEEKVLAREAATSFFNVLSGKSIKDFDDFRISKDELQYRDATLTFSAIGNSSDEVGLSAVAYVGDASHSIMGTVVRSGGGGLLDALTIDGPLNVSGANGSSFMITGEDTNPGEAIGSGTGDDTYGVRAIEKSAAAAINSSINGTQITGIGGNDSVTAGSSGLDMDALHTQIMTYGSATTLSGGSRMKGNDTLGSRETPGVFVVNGDFTMTGNSSGYGVLLVNGNFTAAKGTPKWEGLVYVTGNGASSTIKGTVDIYGAMILRSQSDSEDADPADFYINGNVNLMYSSQALSNMPDVLPSLNAAPPVLIELGEVREFASHRSPSTDEYSSYKDFTSTQTDGTNPDYNGAGQ